MLVISISLSVIVLSYITAGRVHKWAHRRQLLVIPNARSLHQEPTPTGGGIGIVIATLFAIILSVLLRPAWIIPGFLLYIFGGLLVAVVSWWDDFVFVVNKKSHSVHFVAALMMLFGIGHYEFFELPQKGIIGLGWVGYPFTLIWIVGLINAYNFTDGIDGNAGSQGIIAGLIWAIAGSFLELPLVSLIGLFTAAACLGLLGHNWQPARIFMGDVGSTFLGFTFASLPIVAYQLTGSPRILLFGGLAVAPLIWDAIYTATWRLSKGEPIFNAHRTYLYQRVVSMGYSHRFVTTIYAVLLLALGVCGIFYLALPGPWRWGFLALAASMLTLQVVIVFAAEKRTKLR